MSRPLRSSRAAAVALPISLTRDELGVEEDLTPYERERAAQLQRNRARLAELDVKGAVAQLAPVVKPKTTAAKKGVASKRKAPVSDTEDVAEMMEGATG